MAEPRRIAALAYPGVQLLDIAGPLEAFNLAAQQMLDDGETRVRLYEPVVVGKTRGTVASMSGIGIEATRALGEPVDDLDTLIVPGALTGATAFFEDPDYVDWIRSAHGHVRRICSVCSGALLLAAAGLLDGRRATTHWMDAEQLRRQFPEVRVEADRIFIEDDGIHTSGGITAGIDLALKLVEDDHNRQLALKTAKRLLVFLRRPGDQLQFNSFLAAQVRPTRFEALLDWIPSNLDEALDTATLARRACMSERTFRRRFESELGVNPRHYVTQARITKAQGLIESTALSFADIARRCGFSSPDAMRYSFRRELDVTPRDYRRRFGGTETAGNHNRRSAS